MRSLTHTPDPDGAKFKLVDTGATEPSLFFVSLNVSSLAKAREYYTGAFQMQEFKDVPGASKVDSSMVVGFSDKQMRLELVEFTKEPIRFEEGKGRMATGANARCAAFVGVFGCSNCSNCSNCLPAAHRCCCRDPL